LMKSIFLSLPFSTVLGQPANICESATLSQFLLQPDEINRFPGCKRTHMVPARRFSTPHQCIPTSETPRP
jgi:hypothetical protein